MLLVLVFFIIAGDFACFCLIDEFFVFFNFNSSIVLVMPPKCVFCHIHDYSHSCKNMQYLEEREEFLNQRRLCYCLRTEHGGKKSECPYYSRCSFCKRRGRAVDHPKFLCPSNTKSLKTQRAPTEFTIPKFRQWRNSRFRDLYEKDLAPSRLLEPQEIQVSITVDTAQQVSELSITSGQKDSASAHSPISPDMYYMTDQGVKELYNKYLRLEWQLNELKKQLATKEKELATKEIEIQTRDEELDVERIIGQFEKLGQTVNRFNLEEYLSSGKLTVSTATQTEFKDEKIPNTRLSAVCCYWAEKCTDKQMEMTVNWLEELNSSSDEAVRSHPIVETMAFFHQNAETIRMEPIRRARVAGREEIEEFVEFTEKVKNIWVPDSSDSAQAHISQEQDFRQYEYLLD